MFKFTPKSSFFFLKLFLITGTFTIITNAVKAQKIGSISGIVLEKSTQQAIPGVVIQIEGTKLGSATDINGRFRVLNIPVKTYNMVISSIGYKKLTLYNIVVTSGNENVFNIELEEETKSLNEITINGNNKDARVASLETPLSVQRLTAEEIRSNPGGSFDISKVIQTLPGVGGGQGGGTFRNDIIIRGGAPNENVF